MCSITLLYGLFHVNFNLMLFLFSCRCFLLVSSIPCRVMASGLGLGRRLLLGSCMHSCTLSSFICRLSLYHFLASCKIIGLVFNSFSILLTCRWICRCFCKLITVPICLNLLKTQALFKTDGLLFMPRMTTQPSRLLYQRMLFELPSY